MSDYIEVLDETDPGSNLVGDTLIHTDIKYFMNQIKVLILAIVKMHMYKSKKYFQIFSSIKILFFTKS